MAIDFPNSPVTNATYTVGDRTWVYDGEKWGISAVATTAVLDNLADVGILSAQSNQLIQYNSSTSLWSNVSNVTMPGNVAVTGRFDVSEIRETVTDSTVTTNVLTMDYTAGCVVFVTSTLSANFTLNLTNAPTDNGYSVTVSVFVTQGATGYYPNAFQIAGASQTIKWSGGTPTPTSSSGKIDIYSFTCVRRASTWTVFANASLNY